MGEEEPPEAPSWESMTSEDSIEEPTPLPLARWFSWEMNGWMDSDWTTIVADETPQAYLFEVDEPNVAVFESMWQWSTIGPHDKHELTERTDEDAFVYYEFPLHDGKTWSTVWTLSGEDIEVTHQATYHEAIDTGEGTFPGFEIEASTDDAGTWSYDYVPAIGWMTHLSFERSDGVTEFELDLTGWGDGWEGTTYSADVDLLTSTFQSVRAIPEPGAEPNPHAAFEASEGLDRLFLQTAAWASAGASQTTIVDPTGTIEQEQAVNPEPDGAFAYSADFYEPHPGAWNVLFTSAGANTGGWVAAWGATLSERTV